MPAPPRQGAGGGAPGTTLQTHAISAMCLSSGMALHMMATQLQVKLKCIALVGSGGLGCWRRRGRGPRGTSGQRRHGFARSSCRVEVGQQGYGQVQHPVMVCRYQCRPLQWCAPGSVGGARWCGKGVWKRWLLTITAHASSFCAWFSQCSFQDGSGMAAQPRASCHLLSRMVLDSVLFRVHTPRVEC